MSNNNSIYSKPILFAVLAFVVIMVGTVVTTLYPLIRSDMHPRLEALEPYTALELAGRDIYQREGCSLCHTQTVRPLKADVMRYGDYSKAGESADERPFLWGTRRTGPDLARIGQKYPEQWHLQHFVNPQKFAPKSNMPRYTWLDRAVDATATEKHMMGLGYSYTSDEIQKLAKMSELEALTAYMMKLGHAVDNVQLVTLTEEDYAAYDNRLRGNTAARELGRSIYEAECAGCHGLNGKGNISVTDFTDYEIDEESAFLTIANGFEGMMPHFISIMTRDQIAGVLEYLKTFYGGDK